MDGGMGGARSALGELQLNVGVDDGISDDGAGALAPPSAAQLMERSAATQEGVAALLSFGAEGGASGASGSNEAMFSDRMLRELEQLAARPLPPPVDATIELYGDLVWQLPLLDALSSMPRCHLRVRPHTLSCNIGLYALLVP
jgi:hypothetical protein